VDAGLKKDYNHDTDSGVRRPVVHAAGYKTGTPTRCHSVALHSDCAVLYEVCILSLVPGLVRGPRLGFSLGGQGGEQVQSLCLVDPTADRVAKYDGQANSIRRLCSTRDEESALHMIATWSYSKRAWRGLEQWLGIAWQPLRGHNYRRFKSWWSQMTQPNRPGAADRTQKFIYITWNCGRKDAAGSSTTRPCRINNCRK
jgi:hypothetical protein